LFNQIEIAMNEFEIITEKTANFKAFINVLKYRAPHLHAEFELALVLYGELLVTLDKKSYKLSTGDIICLNPFVLHELSSAMNVPILFIQVSPSFFKNTVPMMKNIDFLETPIIGKSDSKAYGLIREKFIEFAMLFFKQEKGFALRCNGVLSLLFAELLDYLPYKMVSSQDYLNNQTKARRIKRIAEYIDRNYQGKICLSDLAKLENVTETHISHFFTENFHITFQQYLMKLRCEKARSLLLTTNLPLIDISVTCGFSDPKYLNSGFIKQYGVLPKEYRKSFGDSKLELQQSSLLSTQQILSNKTSLALLQRSVDLD